MGDRLGTQGAVGILVPDMKVFYCKTYPFCARDVMVKLALGFFGQYINSIHKFLKFWDLVFFRDFSIHKFM